jgi:hypothetical protein
MLFIFLVEFSPICLDLFSDFLNLFFKSNFILLMTLSDDVNVNRLLNIFFPEFLELFIALSFIDIYRLFDRNYFLGEPAIRLSNGSSCASELILDCLDILFLFGVCNALSELHALDFSPNLLVIFLRFGLHFTDRNSDCFDIFPDFPIFFCQMFELLLEFSLDTRTLLL